MLRKGSNTRQSAIAVLMAYGFCLAYLHSITHLAREMPSCSVRAAKSGGLHTQGGFRNKGIQC